MTLLFILGLLAIVITAGVVVLGMVNKIIPGRHSFWHEFKSDASSHRLAVKHNTTNLQWPRV